jgi:transposase InsO family protein
VLWALAADIRNVPIAAGVEGDDRDLHLALAAAGLAQTADAQRPRLLSNNAPSYLSGPLVARLAEHDMPHTRGKPYNPITQGKIERYYRSMKNQILLDHYYLPAQLEAHPAEFITYYNNCRYHESLNNLTPAEIYFDRARTILARRQRIKLKTIELRRRLHHQAVT